MLHRRSGQCWYDVACGMKVAEFGQPHVVAESIEHSLTATNKIRYCMDVNTTKTVWHFSQKVQLVLQFAKQ